MLSAHLKMGAEESPSSQIALETKHSEALDSDATLKRPQITRTSYQPTE